MNRETLSVPREESLPVQFNYTDVVRHTQTHLDTYYTSKNRQLLESRWRTTTIWILDWIHELHNAG